MPYGTPVWLASSGPQTQLQKLVMAQDTGSAITGAVRADYFAGSGAQAGGSSSRCRCGFFGLGKEPTFVVLQCVAQAR